MAGSRPSHHPSLHIPLPRLLPTTILVMALLLAVKSAGLVMAATPSTPAEAKPEPGKTAPAKPASAKPEAGKAEPAKPDMGKPEAAKPETGQAANVVAAPAQQSPAEPPISESERALLTDLRQRRVALDARERQLATREATLAAVEKRLTGRIDELGVLQKRLEALERQRAEHDDANWKGLVKVYEAMKPRDAAGILSDMDVPVLMPVLDRMKETKVSAILAAMPQERARQITAELAQLRARANAVDPPPPNAAQPLRNG